MRIIPRKGYKRRFLVSLPRETYQAAREKFLDINEILNIAILQALINLERIENESNSTTSNDVSGRHKKSNKRESELKRADSNAEEFGLNHGSDLSGLSTEELIALRERDS